MKLKENQKIIEQVIDLPEKSEEIYTKDFELFIDNLNIILRHTDLIIRTPELFHSSFYRSHIGLTLLGGHYIPLGVLLKLWRDEILIGKCNECSGKLYIFSGGGSPLSGMNSCTGVCGRCKVVSTSSLPSIGPIMKSFKILRSNLNKRKVIRTRGQYFTWKHGLTGKAVPDKIIKDSVVPVGMEELIFKLKKNEYKESINEI